MKTSLNKLKPKMMTSFTVFTIIEFRKNMENRSVEKIIEKATGIEEMKKDFGRL